VNISINELNDILNKMEDLKQENESLKLDLKEKSREIRNLEKRTVTSQMIMYMH
jgi:hypothetical protein